ncbi:MAG: hypothetical protein NXH95_16890 [Pseudomonadaceae bacterium]|nr:hypothetical protein [Pseudomonadaceae bacterium]
MRNLFNNPWFVAALGLFATIYLGVSVTKPLFGSSTTNSANVQEIGMLDEFSVANNVAVTTRRNGESRDAIGWLNDLSRDPFEGSAFDSLQAEGGVVGPGATLPRVEAVFLGGGVKAAVLNNKLLRVGDAIDRFVVTEIGAEHVEVTRNGKSYRLEPDV